MGEDSVAFPQEPFVARKLIDARTVFLIGELDNIMSKDTAEKLIIMDRISKKPIRVIINSEGGFIDSGIFLIDMLQGLRSPIHTIINGMASSMAAILSVTGDKRFMTCNSSWMAHSGTYGAQDTLERLHDRQKFYEQTEAKLQDILLEHTKLTMTDINLMKKGELWLSPKQALEKGIIDQILGGPKKCFSIRRMSDVY